MSGGFDALIPASVREKIARGEVEPPEEPVDDHPEWPLPVKAFGPKIGKFARKATKTSREAAIAVYPRTGTQKYKILRLLAHAGARGLICDEAEARLEAAHQSVSARWNELWHLHKFIKPTGATRRTRNGADAEVFVLTDEGRAAMIAHGDWA